MTREGSGSLLLTVRKHLNPDEQKLLSYYGQEKNTATFNLTRMNLLLHGVRPESMTIKNGDSLDEDWPEDPKRPGEGIQFDAVVMNPPYSLSNWNKGELKITDPRFESVGALPPDSKGDYAFLLHGLYHLAPQGTMAIVLPHGVLFRGASEGQIRQKLLQSSKIDTIIGLPANLFTNTGIPVCVMILKKDRNLDDPVLFIDASKSFVKEGKQNALQDKDIAKIVDVYRERKEITGYSKLASTDEIIENEYNLNIPRYVDSIDEEIPHDVDAHLFGGIPKKNITQLNVLNNTVKDTLYSHFDEVRPGYLKLNTSIEELSDSIFKDQYIIEKTEAVKVSVETYIGKYMDEIRKIDNVKSISLIKERMLSEIRDIIGVSRFINEYDGYQIVSEIWNDFLKKDSEVIAQKGFYDSGKSRVPNMVKKGKSSEEIQEGWNGVIISNELIEKYLYKEEREQIEDIQSSIQEIESELNELVELAKQDDTDENIALYESLKKDKEGEVKDSFDNAAIKRELAKADKESLDYSLFSKVNEFNKDKTALTKTLKDREKELKNKVYERFEKLTEGEIDELLYIKWFKDSKTRLLELVRKPLESELAIIKMLNERYSDTIEDIDAQIAQITKEFEELASQLVVTE